VLWPVWLTMVGVILLDMTFGTVPATAVCQGVLGASLQHQVAASG
jgi:hypothetical protein